MKHILLYILALSGLMGISAFTYPTEKLLDPAVFAETLKNPAAKKPILFNVGPTPMLSGAQAIGNIADPANKEKMKTALKTIPKDSDIVIYCGCCKLEDCWNIHDADALLSSMGYTNYKILNLPTDFTTDWLNKKYPMP